MEHIVRHGIAAKVIRYRNKTVLRAASVSRISGKTYRILKREILTKRPAAGNGKKPIKLHGHIYYDRKVEPERWIEECLQPLQWTDSQMYAARCIPKPTFLPDKKYVNAAIETKYSLEIENKRYPILAVFRERSPAQ